MQVAYTFLHVWRQFACSVGDYQQKFLHRSSGGSLLRVRCWLGPNIDSFPSLGEAILLQFTCQVVNCCTQVGQFI